MRLPEQLSVNPSKLSSSAARPVDISLSNRRFSSSCRLESWASSHAAALAGESDANSKYDDMADLSPGSKNAR
jgi:hypothetical protein